MTLTPELARLQNTYRFEIHGLPQHPTHGAAIPFISVPCRSTRLSWFGGPPSRPVADAATGPMNVTQEEWNDVGLVVMDALEKLYQHTFPTLKPSRNPTDYRWFFVGTKLNELDGLDLPSYELHARSESWTWAPIQ